MPSILRYRHWAPVPKRGYVQGRFYLGGQLIKRAIATLEEAEYLPDGTKAPGAAAEKRRDKLLTARWDAMLAELQQAEKRKPRATPAELTPLSRAWAAWLKEIGPTVSERTVGIYAAGGKSLVEALGDVPAGDLDADRVAAFRAALRNRGLRKASVNVDLKSLRAFLRWAYQKKMVRWLPAVKLETVPVTPESPPREAVRAMLAHLVAERARAQTPEEVRRARNLHRFYVLGIASGARLSERIFLPLDLMDWEASEFHIRENKHYTPKHGKPRPVPVQPWFSAFLKAELAQNKPKERWWTDDGEGNPYWLDPNRVSVLMGEAWEKIGYPKRDKDGNPMRRWKATHGDRSFYATELIEAGAEETALQHLLGHSTVSMTRTYVSRRESQKRRALEAYDFGALVEPGSGEPPKPLN